jgi:hypothetical protein
MLFSPLFSATESNETATSSLSLLELICTKRRNTMAKTKRITAELKKNIEQREQIARMHILDYAKFDIEMKAAVDFEHSQEGVYQKIVYLFQQEKISILIEYIYHNFPSWDSALSGEVALIFRKKIAGSQNTENMPFFKETNQLIQEYLDRPSPFDNPGAREALSRFVTSFAKNLHEQDKLQQERDRYGDDLIEEEEE